MQQMKIKNLFYYPVKSMSCVEVSSLEYGISGPKHDREWVLVDSNHRFLSQRDFPVLAALRPSVKKDSLEILHPSGEVLIAPHDVAAQTDSVRIWKDTVEACFYPFSVNAILSDWLQLQVHLVRYNPKSPRLRSKPRGDFETRFADGFQFLLTNTNSLKKLNDRLNEQIPMDRFRANIVVEAPEGSELLMDFVVIGKNKFKVIQPCQRCVMITIDQHTGMKTASKALKALTQESDERAPVFGSYLKAESLTGVINVEDDISFISENEMMAKTSF